MEKSKAIKALLTMMLVVFLSCAGIALPYPILAPLFLNEVTPLTTFANIPAKLLLGMLLAIYPLGVLIGSSLIGAASDIYGRKKVLMFTLLGSLIGYLLSAYALINENYPLFLLTRLLTGICEGNISIAKAIAIDLSKTLDKTRSFSLINATTYAGWMLGPLAGGFLQPLGTELAFYVAAMSMGLAVLCVYAFLNHPQQISSQSNEPWYKQVIEQNSYGLLKNQSIRKLFTVYILITLALNAFYSFYPLWLVETFNFSSPDIGTITALLTTFMIVTSGLFMTPFKRKFGILSGIYIGMSFLALLLFCHLFYSSSSVWIGYAMIGVAISLFNGLLPVFISEQHKEEQQGRLMGLLTTGFSLSNVIMSLLGSLLALLGSMFPILLGGILTLLAIFYLRKITINLDLSD